MIISYIPELELHHMFHLKWNTRATYIEIMAVFNRLQIASRFPVDQ